MKKSGAVSINMYKFLLFLLVLGLMWAALVLAAWGMVASFP